MARAAVKRQKVLTAPPSMCSGCYWQSLTRLLREENSQLRKSLIKARAEKRTKPKPEFIPDDEPAANVETLVEADLVELFERGSR